MTYLKATLHLDGIELPLRKANIHAKTPTDFHGIPKDFPLTTLKVELDGMADPKGLLAHWHTQSFKKVDVEVRFYSATQPIIYFNQRAARLVYYRESLAPNIYGQTCYLLFGEIMTEHENVHLGYSPAPWAGLSRDHIITGYDATLVNRDFEYNTVNAATAPDVSEDTPESDIDILFKNPTLQQIRQDALDGKTLKSHADKLSVEERAVIKYYTTNEGYKEFNEALRGERPMTPFYAAQERVLNGALDKLPRHTNIVCRGPGASECEKFENAQVGDIIEYDDFVSTSMDEDIAHMFRRRGKGKYLVSITPKNASMIAQFSDAYEDEVLIKSKGKYEVTNKGYTYDADLECSVPMISLKEL